MNELLIGEARLLAVSPQFLEPRDGALREDTLGHIAVKVANSVASLKRFREQPTLGLPIAQRVAFRGRDLILSLRAGGTAEADGENRSQ